MNGNLINKLITKYQNYDLNYPRYSDKDLYYGKIVIACKETAPAYAITIKPFALFYKNANGTFTHIKSGKRLKTLSSIKDSGLAVKNIQPFSLEIATESKVFNDYDKWTKNQLIKLEQTRNPQQSISIKAPHIFGV